MTDRRMRGGSAVDDEGDGFAWTVEEFDRQMTPSLTALMVDALATVRIDEDRAAGGPVRSRAQAELEALEYLLQDRQLRERAASGDAEALRELVEKAARSELDYEEIGRKNEETIAMLERGG